MAATSKPTPHFQLTKKKAKTAMPPSKTPAIRKRLLPNNAKNLAKVFMCNTPLGDNSIGESEACQPKGNDTFKEVGSRVEENAIILPRISPGILFLRFLVTV